MNRIWQKKWDVTYRLSYKETMAFVLGTLTLPWVTHDGGIQLPCHEITPWRDPLSQGQRPGNNHVVSLELDPPWSWPSEETLTPAPQLDCNYMRTWDRGTQLSYAQILDPKHWSNKCLLTYCVQSNALHSNKTEYTTALYLCSKCVTLDLDSQNVLSDERNEEKKLEG